MTKSFFDAYGELARSGASPTELSGRYETQAEAERRIVADVSKKLDMDSNGTLLEIGCGIGTLLIPLSSMAARSVGVDHPDIISRARQGSRGGGISWIAGRFPEVMFDERFDRVLLYSVVQCAVSTSELFRLVDAAVDLLKSGGRLLIGDIPNRDRKQRFLQSEAGQAFEIDWQKSRPKNPSKNAGSFDEANAIGSLSDDDVVQIVQRYRAMSCHVYILPQPIDLPFGHTREDILIVRP